MKNEDKRKVAMQIINQMKPGKLYRAKELANQTRVSLTWQKHLTVMEMAAFLREMKRKELIENVTIGGKGYWRKVEVIPCIYAS